MRIGIQTWGSYGDVRPFLALAGGLVDAGHEVTLNVTSIDASDFTATAQQMGVKLAMVGAIEMGMRADLVELARRIVASANPITQLRIIIREFFAPYAEVMYQAALNLCAGSDLVLGHFAHYPVRIAAAQTATPYVSVILFHGMVANSSRPPIGLPDLGRYANRLAWRLLQGLTNHLIRPYINDFRRQHGLADIKDCFEQAWLSPQLNLIGVSEAFCPQPAEWGERFRVCGFFDSGRIANEGEVPDDLQTFISAGTPPVFMSFGSMLFSDRLLQRETMEIFAAAAEQAGCRAIIQASLWRDCGMRASERLFFTGECNHGAIFPQCVAVVHHGGSGTTQAATKAGVPSIIVVHLADQMGWAHATRRLGIAPRFLRRHTLSAERLAGSLREVLTSAPMQARAREIGARVRQENGVATAVALLEERFTRRRNRVGGDGTGDDSGRPDEVRQARD